MGNCTKTFFEQFLVFTANKTNVNRVWFKLHPLLSFLKDELKTNSLLRFIGHIYINDENLKISKSVLKFSEVLGLQIKARIVKIDRKSNESKLLIIEVSIVGCLTSNFNFEYVGKVEYDFFRTSLRKCGKTNYSIKSF